MPNKLNTLMKQELVDALQNVPSAFYVDFTGVGAEETYALRKLLHEQDVTLRVVKNSLARIALKELGTDVDEGAFSGPVGLAFSEDPVRAAKTLLDHKKSRRRSTLKVKGGFLERQKLAAEDVEVLSQLPSREQMLGIVAGTFAAPISSFIGVQAGIIRKLLYGLQAIQEKKEAA